MASIWLLIGIIIAIVFVVMKIASKKQEIMVKLVLVIFMILMMTFGYVYVKADAPLNSFDGFVDFGKYYFSWFGSVFENIKILTTNAVNLEWEAENETSAKS